MFNWPLIQEAFGKINGKYIYIKDEELNDLKLMRKFKLPEMFTAYPTMWREGYPRGILISVGPDELIRDSRPIAVDLFSGAGGFSLGIILAGFRVVASVEIAQDAHLTYCLNIPDSQMAPLHCYSDITKIHGREILNNLNLERGDIDLVVGSPPCQSFSLAGKRKIGDVRDNLLFEYQRLVMELQPKCFCMENVPGLKSKKLPDGRKVMDVFRL